MNLRPIGNRALLKPIEKKETVDGVFIPDSVKDKPVHFIVQALGQGWVNEKGQNVPIKSVKVGDTVLIERHGGLEIKNDQGQIRRIINANEILAVLED